MYDKLKIGFLGGIKTMTKLFKIIALFTLLSSIFTYANADTTNLYNDIENETANTTSDDSAENTTTDNEIGELEEDNDLTGEDVSSNARSSTPSANAANINTLSSISEANLGLNNILCIILIAIGVLIVLLAIAILIRLKK